MSEPAQHRLGGLDARTRRDRGPVDQHDRQTQLPRGIELGARALAACVLGHDPLDLVTAQKLQILGQREGAAGGDRLRPGQGQRIGRIDEAQQVVMLRPAREGREMQAPDGEEDPRGRLGQRLGGGLDRGDADPAVPGPAAQGARSSATSAVPVAAQASTAFRLICAANGWVASMTWVMPSSRM